MRIISGKHKGRPIKAPPGRETRPTSDRAREAIFNILDHTMDGPGIREGIVLDIFAGTGALGLEALSRGASFCTFVENNVSARAILQSNIETLNEHQHSLVLNRKAPAIGDAQTGSDAADYAFLDAPYQQGLSAPTLVALDENGWLKNGAVLMVEVAHDETFPCPQNFSILKEKTYGAARAIFLIHNIS